jgi:glutamate-1-semialdehyde 2,1-aminomutase
MTGRREDESMSTDATRETVEDGYIAANPTSRDLYKGQTRYVPSGVTHSSRVFKPFPLFIRRCFGARKWDVDGHEYIDYWLGHGANLLGHAHPAVVAAVHEQLEGGFHAGGETVLGSRWSELVCELVPSAEQVRFTASGGEATQLALRLARAATSRNKIIKFQHYYHGWHDAVGIGITEPFDEPYAAGITPGALEDTVVLPANDIERVRAAMDQEDVAGIIVEPGGGFSDTVPINPEFLTELRSITEEYGAVLIFDEVVTGFRYAVGGAQEYFGVLPDVTALGKVVGGGIPCGAVAGRRRIMDLMKDVTDCEDQETKLIPQYGTWNANPLAAAAGVATLKVVATREPIETANARADQLRDGLNDLFARIDLPASAYGRSSIWKTVLGERPKMLDGDFSNYVEDAKRLSKGWGEADAPLRQAMLLNGVDLIRANGFMSNAHRESDIELTIDAFERSIERLRREGVLEQ